MSAKNAAGQTAAIRITEDVRYESFRIPRSSDCVKAAISAVKSLGMDARTSVCNGGLDANWMKAHSFPTVTLGCGQHNIHTVDERLNITEYLQACMIAMAIAAA